MSNDLFSVLDLGSTKVSCATFDFSGDDLQLVAFAATPCKGVRRGAIVDLDETSQAIKRVLADASNQVGHTIESVIVGVGGQGVEGLTGQGFVPIYPRSRSITREDVLQVINHSRQVVVPPDREQIQAIPREFRVDGQRGVTKPIGMSGSKLEVFTYLVMGQVTQVQNVEKAIQNGGAKVEMMVLEPLASGLGVLSPQDLEVGSAVLDIGGSASSLAVFANGSIAYSASLPIGGSHVTSDLSKLLKTSPEEAERLKLSDGGAMGKIAKEHESVQVLQLGQTQARSMQRTVLCEIIESRLRELATMVRQHIERSGLNGVLPGGLVVTGGGCRMPGIEALFQDVLKHMSVRRGVPSLGDRRLDEPEYATLVGLAKFANDSCADELGTAGGTHWKERIRTFWSLLSGKN